VEELRVAVRFSRAKLINKIGALPSLR
jgi:hypothetical protein